MPTSTQVKDEHASRDTSSMLAGGRTVASTPIPDGDVDMGAGQPGSKRKISAVALDLGTGEDATDGKDDTAAKRSALMQRIQQIKQWEADSHDVAAVAYLRSLEDQLGELPAAPPKATSVSRVRHSIASMQRQLASIIGHEEKAEAKHTAALAKEDEIIRQATKRKEACEQEHKAQMDDLALNKARAAEAISKMQAQLKDSPDEPPVAAAKSPDRVRINVSDDCMGLVSYVENVCQQDAYGLPPELVTILKHGMLEYLASDRHASASSGLSGPGAGDGGTEGASRTLPNNTVAESPAKAPRPSPAAER